MTIVKVAVIVLQFVGYQAPHPQIMDQTRADVAQVDAFYAEQSYGQFATHSDTYGMFTVQLDATANRLAIAAAAQQALLDAGVDLAEYGWSGTVGGRCHCVYVTPSTNLVGAGYGDGNGVWVALHPDYTVAPQFRIVAHEQGHHLFGLLHAHGPIGDRGDMLDIMGYGYGAFNAVTKKNLGWLAPPQEVTDTGYYTLTPFEAADGLRVFKIYGGNKQPWFLYFEYRQPIGFDAALTAWAPASNVFNGAVVHRETNGQSYILEMNPRVSTTETYPALVVGQTYCNREARYSVTVVSANPEGLMLYVRFGNCR